MKNLEGAARVAGVVRLMVAMIGAVVKGEKNAMLLAAVDR